LVEEAALTLDAARWAVETWGLALGKVRTENLIPAVILETSESGTIANCGRNS
jgi:hypothetical protein